MHWRVNVCNSYIDTYALLHIYCIAYTHKCMYIWNCIYILLDCFMKAFKLYVIDLTFLLCFKNLTWFLSNSRHYKKKHHFQEVYCVFLKLQFYKKRKWEKLYHAGLWRHDEGINRNRKNKNQNKNICRRSQRTLMILTIKRTLMVYVNTKRVYALAGGVRSIFHFNLKLVDFVVVLSRKEDIFRCN